MPLGCTVKVRNGRETLIGTMSKHDRGQQCIVDFAEHNVLTLAANPYAEQPFAWVTYANVKPVAVHRVRPWWRVLYDPKNIALQRAKLDAK